MDLRDRVGEEGMGLHHVQFEMERLIAARSTGFAECAFEDAARYANQRIAFAKPAVQMIQKSGVNLPSKSKTCAIWC